LDYFVTRYDIEPPGGAECCVLEDSIMHRGRPVTAGSKIIENFISPLDATVVTRLETAGITILGKTKMGEFGAAGLFSAASGHISGAVSAVADGLARFALCNDYTGAVGEMAAAGGLYYIHPTYGTVSRYGLIPAVPSMDQIGIVCKTLSDGFRALDIISGHDPNDGAMYPAAASPDEKTENNNRQSTQIRLGVPVNVTGRDQDAAAVKEFAKNCSAVDFELKHFGLFAQVMQILCGAELSNNISRYDGIKFGYRAEGYRDLPGLYKKTRTEAFGPDAKLAAITGAMVLTQENYTRYYDKAMRIRRLISESLDFDKYDAIIMPSLELQALPRLCGLPAVTMPYAGGGITLIADRRREDILMSAIC